MALNIKLLEDSFNLLSPQGEALVARFYERLFERYPAVIPLFRERPGHRVSKGLGQKR